MKRRKNLLTLVLLAGLGTTIAIGLFRSKPPEDGRIEVQGTLQVRIFHGDQTYLVIEDENQQNYYCPLETDVPNGFEVTVRGHKDSPLNSPSFKQEDIFLKNCELTRAQEPGGFLDW